MSNNVYFITADQIADYLPVFYHSKRVPLFVGKPGIAKTAFVREGALRLGNQLGKPVTVREMHLASMSEVDVRGFLVPNGDKSTFTKPEFWEAVEANPYGILFIDEFVQATHECQKAVASLILEGRIGEWRLPPGWCVVLAGNGLDDMAGANSLLSHIVNRVDIVNVRAPDVDEWVMWGQKQGLPFEILAFAKFRPNVVFDSDIPPSPDTPYCTPRSLHCAGDLANAYPGGIRAMIDERAGMAFLSGAIGQGPAGELVSVVRTAINLPSYESVIKDPHGTEIPTQPDARYAMVMLMAVRAKVPEAEAVVTYLTRFQPNFAITGLVSLVRRDRAFAACKPMLRWVDNNRDLLAKFAKYITDAVA